MFKVEIVNKIPDFPGVSMETVIIPKITAISVSGPVIIIAEAVYTGGPITIMVGTPFHLIIPCEGHHSSSNRPSKLPHGIHLTGEKSRSQFKGKQVTKKRRMKEKLSDGGKKGRRDLDIYGNVLT